MQELHEYEFDNSIHNLSNFTAPSRRKDGNRVKLSRRIFMVYRDRRMECGVEAGVQLRANLLLIFAGPTEL